MRSVRSVPDFERTNRRLSIGLPRFCSNTFRLRRFRLVLGFESMCSFFACFTRSGVPFRKRLIKFKCFHVRLTLYIFNTLLKSVIFNVLI